MKNLPAERAVLEDFLGPLYACVGGCGWLRWQGLATAAMAMALAMAGVVSGRVSKAAVPAAVSGARSVRLPDGSVLSASDVPRRMDSGLPRCGRIVCAVRYGMQDAGCRVVWDRRLSRAVWYGQGCLLYSARNAVW